MNVNLRLEKLLVTFFSFFIFYNVSEKHMRNVLAVSHGSLATDLYQM